MNVENKILHQLAYHLAENGQASNYETKKKKKWNAINLMTQKKRRTLHRRNHFGMHLHIFYLSHS